MNNEIIFTDRQAEIYGAAIAHLCGKNTLAALNALLESLCRGIMDYTEDTSGADADPAGAADNQVDVWLRNDVKALLRECGAPMYPTPRHA